MCSLQEFIVRHALRAGQSEAVGIAKGPADPFVRSFALGKGQHEARRTGDQRRKQGVEMCSGLFDGMRRDLEFEVIGRITLDGFGAVIGLHIEFGKDAVAGRVGKQFEHLLIRFQALRVLRSPPRLSLWPLPIELPHAVR